ncbi:MAG TPA: hypothetical protein VL181_09535 [Holophagaceae bacterium]|nr:hypothetical protein [Holophagaceae bacterium]
MSHAPRVLAASSILLALVACGGGGDSSSSAQAGFTASSAAAFSTALVSDESVQATPSNLPSWAPDPEGKGADVKTLANLTPASSCVTAGPVTVDGQGVSHVTWTYTNCTGPEGGTINGTRDISWSQDPGNANATDYTIVPHLTITNGTKTWVFEGGTRGLVVDTVAMSTTITVRDMSATLTDSSDPGFSATYTWSRDMVADWSVSGQYKLSGTFTWQNSANDRGPVTGSIAASDPLIWVSGCCHPESGTISLTRVTSGATATAAFTTPCGTLNLTWGRDNTATVHLLCPQ